MLPKISLPETAKYIEVDIKSNFFELFKSLEVHFETCFILESLGEYGRETRYSIIGFNPKHILKAREQKLYFDKQVFEVNNPYNSLKEILPQENISRNYAGGLVGYISYEAINYFESILKLPEHQDFFQFEFGVYTDGLIYDKLTGQTFYFYYAENRLDSILEKVRESETKPKPLTITPKGQTLSKEEHTQIVEKVKEKIIAGETFQCEVGFKNKYQIEGDQIKIYEHLRQVNPSPHMYYLKFGDRKLIGASPELLFRLRDGQMETFPLAGTVKRGKDEKEDLELARELLNNPKEIAEHNMLVDLHRNDLGKVAKIGTVKVRKLMDIAKFSHVQHISSEISGIIAHDQDMFSALASNFPAGTLSGAPKIETIKIIAENETEPRGPYGGAVGHFGFNGDCTFCIPIRSLFVSKDQGYAQTCGGIVLDSNPEDEYQEIINKLAAMQKVLNEFVE